MVKVKLKTNSNFFSLNYQYVQHNGYRHDKSFKIETKKKKYRPSGRSLTSTWTSL